MPWISDKVKPERQSLPDNEYISYRKVSIAITNDIAGDLLLVNRTT